MKRTSSRLLCALGLAAALYPSRVAFAQPAPISPPTTAVPDREIIPEVRTQRVSATTATRVLATAPKFIPPTAPGTDHPTDTDRPHDKPSNGIVRLPDYIVKEPKAPAFKARELLTGYGRLQLGYKLNPGLRLGPLPLLNDGVALTMLEENVRLERKAEMEDLTNLITSPTDRAKAKHGAQEAFMRPSFGRRYAK